MENGMYVVVRSNLSGVWVGEFLGRDYNGTIVKLKNARRLWSWEGALSCSEIATKGVNKEQSRICDMVRYAEIGGDICEVIEYQGPLWMVTT